MAIDIVARGLATSLVGPDGKIDSSKMPTINGINNLESFTSIGQLTNPNLIEGKTTEEILLMMLFGIVSPTLINPSLSIELEEPESPFIIGRQSILKGSLIFQRGEINPSYGTSGFRAGLPIRYSVMGYEFDDSNVIYNFSINFIPTNTENIIVYSVAYDEGEQPLNSIGQPFDAPLPSGTITGAINVEAMYAMYDNKGEELSFNCFEDEIGKGYIVNFDMELNGNKQSFAIPAKVKVIGIKQLDSLTQQWTWLGGETAEVSLTYFDTTTITGDSLGETIDYRLYTHNYPIAVGARELRIYTE